MLNPVNTRPHLTVVGGSQAGRFNHLAHISPQAWQQMQAAVAEALQHTSPSADNNWQFRPHEQPDEDEQEEQPEQPDPPRRRPIRRNRKNPDLSAGH